MNYQQLLFEALQLQVIILENRIDFLKQQFLPKIQERFGENAHSLMPEDVYAKVEQQQGDTLADKFFNYVLSVDPDPVKKNSQWLFVQILRKQNPTPIEDLERANEILTKFAEMKKANEIPKQKNDINAYKSLSSLYAFLRGEVETKDLASWNEEQAMLAQCNVYVNNDELLLVHPRTRAAAGYFGRFSEWCTTYGDPRGRHPDQTDNKFDYYNRQGPLYILFDKKDNEWYQFHFESNQFMNSDDINVGSHGVVALLKKFPIVFKMIGEQKFIKFAKLLGLSFFSQETIAKFADDQLANFITSKNDLKSVPREKLTDVNFIIAVLRHNYDNYEAIKWFPKKFVIEHAEKIISSVPYEYFKYLPSEVLTQEFADNFVKNAHIDYRQIETVIPKNLQNSEVIQDHYWKSKITTVFPHMKDIPEKYKREFVGMICTKHPEDIADNERFIDENMAIEIMYGNINAIEKMPEKYLTAEMAKYFEKKIDERSPHYYNLNIIKNYWLRFKPELRPISAVKWLVDNRKIEKFSEIPEEARTVPILATFIKTKRDQIKTIPKEYWTTDLLREIINNYNADLLNYINPAYVPEDLLIDMLGEKRLDDFFFDTLPKKYKTERLVGAFVAKGQVPIKKIPKNMMTEENVLSRLYKDHEEASEIPSQMFSDSFAIKIVLINPNCITAVPQKYYSERLLYAWLIKLAKKTSGQGYYSYNDDEEGKKIFEKFPKSMWSSRTLALAISQHLMEATSKGIPENLIDKNVAEAIVSMNHEEMDHLSDYLLDHDDKITSAVLKNWKLINKLPLKKITEPMAFAIMERFASSAAKNNRFEDDDEELKNTLLLIPKDVWSKRVYEAAVGYIITLKEVPSKWRDDAMNIAAVNRAPDNIKFISNAFDWLNEHKKDLKLESIRSKLEAYGFPLIKGKFIDTKTLDKKPLASGNSYSVLKAGPSNCRIYFFDKKNNFLFYLFTKDRKVDLEKEELKKAKNYKNDILEVARKELTDYDAGTLNILGIYEYRGNYRTEEQSSKSDFEGLSFSEMDHLGHAMFVIWNKVGEKFVPAIRFQTSVSKGAFGNRGGDKTLEYVEVYDKAFAIEHNKTITDFINKEIKIKKNPYSSELNNLGIYFKKNGNYLYQAEASTIASEKIGTIGKYTIYKNDDNKIALFNDDGMIASGVIRAKGNVQKVELAQKYKYLDDDDKQAVTLYKVQQLFNKISNVLEKDKNAKSIHLEESRHRYRSIYDVIVMCGG